ncbi:MAG: hypothetical protein WCX23_03420 [Candidatus Paceibacterota bacterium]|jgi:hypothetical protein|nr:hypothetical protein [Candidatus Paceibacterota bacterium]
MTQQNVSPREEEEGYSHCLIGMLLFLFIGFGIGLLAGYFIFS